MRVEREVTVPFKGRDQGKLFVLTEMPASQAEKWAARAFIAMGRSGADVGDLHQAGMLGIAIIGFQGIASLRWSEVEPLLDEMFACIKYRPQGYPSPAGRAILEEDIEEVATRMWLRREVFALHVGFPSGENFWTWIQAEAAKRRSLASQTTSTSQDQSAQSSQAA